MKAANHVEPESGAHSRGRGRRPPQRIKKGVMANTKRKESKLFVEIAISVEIGRREKK